MLNTSGKRNIGELLLPLVGVGGRAFAASTTQNNDPVNGEIIDRLALTRRYYSAEVVGIAKFNLLDNTKVGTLDLKVQDHGGSTTPAAGSTGWTDYSTGTAPAQATAGTTTTSTADPSPTLKIAQAVDLSGARRYVRCVLTPRMQATSSGSDMVASAAWIMGGADELPTS